MMSLVECRTADEVIQNYRAVRNRVNQWKPRPKPCEAVMQIEQPEIRPVEEKPMDAPASVTVIMTQSGFPTIASIIAVVCAKYGVTRTDILSHRRTRNVVVPRQIAIVLAKRLTLRSLPELGRRFGNRDHTTILHAINKISRMRADDPAFDAELQALERELKPSEPGATADDAR